MIEYFSCNVSRLSIYVHICAQHINNSEGDARPEFLKYGYFSVDFDSANHSQNDPGPPVCRHGIGPVGGPGRSVGPGSLGYRRGRRGRAGAS